MERPGPSSRKAIPRSGTFRKKRREESMFLFLEELVWAADISNSDYPFDSEFWLGLMHPLSQPVLNCHQQDTVDRKWFFVFWFGTCTNNLFMMYSNSRGLSSVGNVKRYCGEI